MELLWGLGIYLFLADIDLTYCVVTSAVSVNKQQILCRTVLWMEKSKTIIEVGRYNSDASISVSIEWILRNITNHVYCAKQGRF